MFKKAARVGSEKHTKKFGDVPLKSSGYRKVNSPKSGLDRRIRLANKAAGAKRQRATIFLFVLGYDFCNFISLSTAALSVDTMSGVSSRGLSELY